MISCTSKKYRRAYGWQRDGGMAEYMVAEEKDLIALPDSSHMPTAHSGLRIGTVYEGLEKGRNRRQLRCADYRTGAGGLPRARFAANSAPNRSSASTWFRNG